MSKHGIDFTDAVGVFDDPFALTQEDPDSKSEPRYISLGADFKGRVLVIVWAERGENIRLISARPATKRELNYYRGG